MRFDCTFPRLGVAVNSELFNIYIFVEPQPKVPLRNSFAGKESASC